MTMFVSRKHRQRHAENNTYPQCQPKLQTQTGKAVERRHKASQHPNWKRKGQENHTHAPNRIIKMTLLLPFTESTIRENRTEICVSRSVLQGDWLVLRRQNRTSEMQAWRRDRSVARWMPAAGTALLLPAAMALRPPHTVCSCAQAHWCPPLDQAARGTRQAPCLFTSQA